jgi:hypothetical protein
MISTFRSRARWHVTHLVTHQCRFLGISGKNRKKVVVNLEDDELDEVRGLYGKRSSKERADSVSDDMLRERLIHKRRMEKTVAPHFVIAALKDMGFGRKRKSNTVYSKVRADPHGLRGFTKTDPKTSTGAGMYN